MLPSEVLRSMRPLKPSTLIDPSPLRARRLISAGTDTTNRALAVL
jgi:hypothetical protein